MKPEASPGENIIPMPKPRSWASSKYSNLRKYIPSGVYHCNARVLGRSVRRSLKTESETIAKLRLDRLLEKERKRLAKRPVADLRFKDLADEYLKRLDSDPDKMPRTKIYRVECVARIRKHCKGIDGMLASRITETHCREWAMELRREYAGTTFNGTLEALHAIFAIGVQLGTIADDPAKDITRASVRVKDVPLPSGESFKKLLARLAANQMRYRAAVTIRFLAFSGVRVGAARLMTPENVDFERNELVLPPIKHQKNALRIPMIKEMRELAAELIENYPGTGPLLPIKNPRAALESACKEVGISRLKPHDLRHYFTTRCIECGVDIRTVAAWRGDKDGGAMLLKRYAHLRNEHSHNMAKLVTF